MLNSDSKPTEPSSSSRLKRITRSGLGYALETDQWHGAVGGSSKNKGSGDTSYEGEPPRSSDESLIHSLPPVSPTHDMKREPVLYTQLPSPPGTKKKSGLAAPHPLPLLPQETQSQRNDSMDKSSKSFPPKGRRPIQASSDSGSLSIDIRANQIAYVAVPNPLSKYPALSNPSSSQTTMHSRSSEHKRKLPGSSISPKTISSAHIPTKKRKTMTSHDLPLNKHSQLWLPDGNTILQLQQTQFNLLRSRLAKASPLFRNLFDQSPINGAGWQGIVIQRQGSDLVYILDDMKVSLKDFEVSFEIFEDSLQYSHQKPPFAAIASVLRVSTVLNFPALKNWANKYFQDIWKPIIKKDTVIDAEDTVTFVISIINPHAAESLGLARELQDVTILKLSFYDLARSNVLPGCVSQSDRAAIASAQQELRQTWARLAASPSFSFSCSSAPASRIKTEHPRAPCITNTPASVVVKYVKAVHTSGLYDKFVFDPICGLQTLIDLTDVWLDHGYCPACISARRKEWQNSKQDVWHQMDEWFGLRLASF